MSKTLIDALNSRTGMVCCVGAGGKKTTMFRLAEAHSGRVGITATAHIEYFPKSLQATKYIAEENALFEQVLADKTSRVIAFAKPSERAGRHAGVSLDCIEKLKASGHFDLIVIKADGARSRFIKAPAEHEPPIPECADTVIPIVSARVIGQRLTTKVAHRIERLEVVAGLNENDKILPVHIARVLTSPEGSLKNVGTAKVIPIINMVDNNEIKKLATEAAHQALSLTDRFDTVVLGCMRQAEPVFELVQR